jgi:hypothetical protein
VSQSEGSALLPMTLDQDCPLSPAWAVCCRSLEAVRCLFSSACRTYCDCANSQGPCGGRGKDRLPEHNQSKFDLGTKNKQFVKFRHDGLRTVTIQLREGEIEELVHKGLLKAEDQGNRIAIANAFHAYLDSGFPAPE